LRSIGTSIGNAIFCGSCGGRKATTVWGLPRLLIIFFLLIQEESIVANIMI